MLCASWKSSTSRCGLNILHVVWIAVAPCNLSVPGQKCKSSLNITTLTAPDTFCSSRPWWLPHVRGLGGKTHSPHSHSARSPVVYKLSSLAFGLVKLYEVSIFLAVGEAPGQTSVCCSADGGSWPAVVFVTDVHCLTHDKSGFNKPDPVIPQSHWRINI